ncbi:hypothetical protein CTA2_4629 [Colletotrichum tanaceti]|uniref:Mid2 domain-containing protein n=1 Tax=Colletotrichum tanaceti TaxID=1306861 RepID=A0A4V6Y9M2_9PEZI|nr:hypothetical protein CTA2_4629 [Colletotrichum tanaceti]TKW60006.1 hypothetical protein CTA1_9893 [Colletotrichum tanaceti]
MLSQQVLLFAIIPLAASQFFSPTQRRELWRIGETKNIRYNTKFTRYTIALWQQALAGGAANLGPVIFRRPPREPFITWLRPNMPATDTETHTETDEGPLKDFEWEVQSYELDLDSSNVFFFWLFEGDPSAQGNQSAPGMSSAFFNITDQPAPKSSAVPVPAPLTTMTTTATDGAAPASTSHVSETSAETQPTPITATRGDLGSATTRPAAEPNGGGGSNDSGSAGGGGLSVGAQAGIGVGIGAVAVTCVVCGIMWCRYLRKKQKALEEWQGMAMAQREPHVYSHGPSGPARQAPLYPGHETKSYSSYQRSGPVEMG